jgi:hypothetical protein
MNVVIDDDWFHINKTKFMSQAFVKENDEMWLQDVSPTVRALIVYLTKENNGIRVYEKHLVKDQENNRDVHVMSNGFSYAKDENSKWYLVS